VAQPLTSEVPEMVLIVGVPGPLFWPASLSWNRALVAFLKVTVIVDVATPSGTEARDGITVEVSAFATNPAKVDCGRVVTTRLE
jgi:hypothetical protein